MDQKHNNNIVAANWKMNILPSETSDLISEIYSGVTNPPELVLCPPFTHLHLVNELKLSMLNLGAQNCSSEERGALTGQISARMLKDIGCEYVILGHSECRQFNNNESELLPKKIKRAVEVGLNVIYCCGEPLELRQNGKYKEFVQHQLDEDLSELENLTKIIIAYEPIWAIGTGLTASPEQAQEMHEFIRKLLVKKFGNSEAQNMKILYGGSVKGNNASSLAGMPDINGVLVGGASLVPKEMKAIIQAFE